MNNAPQVLFIAYDSVVAFFFPQCTAGSEGRVDVPSCNALYRAQNVLQRMVFKRLDYDMAVIWHDGPARQEISLVLKVMQPVAQIVAPTLLTKMAGPIPFVEPAFRGVRDFASIRFPRSTIARRRGWSGPATRKRLWA